MQHLEFAKKNSDRKDIETRLAGRFYTPTAICETLAQQTLVTSDSPESVIDPFCGDGRLIVAWLRAASRKSGMLYRLKAIHLWDCDAKAVAVARNAVCDELQTLNLCSVQVYDRCCDSFATSASEGRRFDLVITNPPWDLLKPDARDAIRNGAEYRDELRSYASRLGRDFPEAHSKRRKAIAGYGLNLARAGALASTQMLVQGGTLSIVLPAAMLADQASEPFRQRLFRSMRVEQINFYPAEIRLFAGVDQPFVTLVGIVGPSTKLVRLCRMKGANQVVDSRIIKVEANTGQHIAFGVGGAEEEIVAELARTHPKLESLSDDLRFGLWLGRELDETRILESFSNNGQGIPFLKGRNVERYGFTQLCLPLVDPGKRKIPNTVSQPRLAWRDVSRPSQKRRMQAALVREGTVTGNSLGVALFRAGSHDLLPVLLGVLNSIIVEIQVRAQLATAHVSQGILRRCAVPWAAFEDINYRKKLSSLVNARLSDPTLEPVLEISIARSYGIQRDEFAELLGSFSKISESEKNILLSRKIWQ